mmetsp:Transcript_10226/g.27271  ORF Transcript_10226/g.27271 Transcript_10226/m.27271 type:complete len:237 (+) Transcript_10226:317-1027(+)
MASEASRGVASYTSTPNLFLPFMSLVSTTASRVLSMDNSARFVSPSSSNVGPFHTRTVARHGPIPISRVLYATIAMSRPAVSPSSSFTAQSLDLVLHTFAACSTLTPLRISTYSDTMLIVFFSTRYVPLTPSFGTIVRFFSHSRWSEKYTRWRTTSRCRIAINSGGPVVTNGTSCAAVVAAVAAAAAEACDAGCAGGAVYAGGTGGATTAAAPNVPDPAEVCTAESGEAACCWLGA